MEMLADSRLEKLAPIALDQLLLEALIIIEGNRETRVCKDSYHAQLWGSPATRVMWWCRCNTDVGEIYENASYIRISNHAVETA